MAGFCATLIVRSRMLPVRAFSNSVDLLLHLAVVAHLVLVRREVAVPQQRHLLFERMGGLQHPVRPPVAEPPRLEHRGPQPVEESIRHRLHRTVPAGLAVDAHRDCLALNGPVRCFRPALRKTVQRRIPQSRLHERLHLRIRDALVLHERPHRALEAGVGELLDLFRRAAEARMRKQVRGAVVVPIRGGNGREVVLPGGRSR